MTEKKAKLSRRSFLLTMGAGAGATAAAIVAKNAATPQPGSTNDKRATRGYHASGHIDNYYRTTKV